MWGKPEEINWPGEGQLAFPKVHTSHWITKLLPFALATVWKITQLPLSLSSPFLFLSGTHIYQQESVIAVGNHRRLPSKEKEARQSLWRSKRRAVRSCHTRIASCHLQLTTISNSLSDESQVHKTAKRKISKQRHCSRRWGTSRSPQGRLNPTTVQFALQTMENRKCKQKMKPAQNRKHRVACHKPIWRQNIWADQTANPNERTGRHWHCQTQRKTEYTANIWQSVAKVGQPIASPKFTLKGAARNKMRRSMCFKLKYKITPQPQPNSLVG